MDNLSTKAPHKLEIYRWKWNVDESRSRYHLAFAFECVFRLRYSTTELREWGGVEVFRIVDLGFLYASSNEAEQG